MASTGLRARRSIRLYERIVSIRMVPKLAPVSSRASHRRRSDQTNQTRQRQVYVERPEGPSCLGSVAERERRSTQDRQRRKAR